jgi:arginine/lysine/ornithine decarboxylase
MILIVSTPCFNSDLRFGLHRTMFEWLMPEALAVFWAELQTSSPSYLLLASLDAARAQAQDPDTFQEPLRAAELARERLRSLNGISLLEDHVKPGVATCHAPVCGAFPVAPIVLAMGQRTHMDRSHHGPGSRPSDLDR